MSNGAVFSYNGSWCAEGMNTSWEADWRVTGSQGSVCWDGTEMPICEIVDRDQKHGFFNQTKKGKERRWGCLNEMFAFLEGDRPVETNCNDNIQSMKIAFGAIESANIGKRILM